MSTLVSNNEIDQGAATLRTPLYALHCELGARMAPFAGYDMPIHYPLGVLKEHLHTRQAAGLFDVSHMGQIAIRALDVATAGRALEALVPVDLLGLAEGRQRYGFFLNSSGGIIDDLMISRRHDHLLLVVNAGRKAVDTAHLRARLAQTCEILPLPDRALLALQGPAAESVIADLAPQVAAMRFMDVWDATLGGIECVIARSGYTGEDGFEISVPAAAAEDLTRLLLKHSQVALIGLGARDSLRIEAGLCLYGTDIDETTRPTEASLAWAIQKERRAGGARAGNFPGAETILADLASGPQRLRVGLRPQDRTPVRAGTLLFAEASADKAVGKVTSGGYGPSVGAPIAMGYVAASHASPGTPLFAEVRGRRLPIEVSSLPFVLHRYKRAQIRS
jgi:aminomethyltransferase